jgi:hypothetical protein
MNSRSREEVVGRKCGRFAGIPPLGGGTGTAEFSAAEMLCSAPVGGVCKEGQEYPKDWGCRPRTPASLLPPNGGTGTSEERLRHQITLLPTTSSLLLIPFPGF